MKKAFIVGMDISSFPSLVGQGLTSLGDELSFLKTLKAKGVTSIRLRLYVDPSDEEGRPYGGGNNDLSSTLIFAKKIRQEGLDVLLDFHYSDFWADPGKQTMPKIWKDLDFECLNVKVYEYTREVLEIFKANKIDLAMIQTGNEITNGMLWPMGKLYEKDQEIDGGFARFARLLKSANKAVREVYPNSEVIIHLDRGGDKNLYHQFFTRLAKHALDYDVIGLSYYPYWHGSLDDLKENLLMIKSSFNKKVMIMETSYAYVNNIGDAPLVMNEGAIERKDGWPPYAFTKLGQKEFMSDLVTLLLSLEIDGLYYWEPAWLYIEGDTWATLEGRRYINETHKKDGNEWANQALFDQKGQANPALEIFNKLIGER